MVTGGWDRTAKGGDAASGKELLALQWDGPGGIWGGAFSPDGQRVGTAGGGTGQVWGEARGKAQVAAEGDEQFIIFGGFFPCGQRIATCSCERAAQVWDAASGKELLTLRRHNPSSVAFSPDGQRIVTGGSDGTAKVWEAASGKELLTLRGHSQVVSSVAFSP